MVELIIVLPIFLLVLFAIVELSRAWYTLQLATAAAREAVRAAAFAPTADVKTVGENRIAAVLATGGVVDECQSDSQSCTSSKNVFLRTPPQGLEAFTTDSEVVADVTVRFRTVFPILIPRLQEIDISQSAAMRHEGE